MPVNFDINHHPIWKKISPVKKPLHFLRFSLARNYAKIFSPDRFIGITGSVGKSTTSLCCYHVLKQKYRTIKTTNNLDTIFNLPITLLKVRPKIEKVILELGVEYPGEMDFYFSLVRPNTAIVTRIAPQHTEFLGGIEGIFAEKSKLVKQLSSKGTAILNWDDPNVRKMAELTKAEVVFYGTNAKNCHIWASNIRIENFKTVFELNYGVERVEVELKLIGEHYVTSALAAAALGLNNGLLLMHIKKGLEEVTAGEHRMQLVEGESDTMILDDTYNNAPAALEAAIDVLNKLPARRRILVLGEMRELGDISQKMHQHIAQKIYTDKIDYVLLGQGDTKYVAEELKSLGYPENRLEENLTNSQIVASVLQLAHKNDLILVKGARSLRFDEVVKRISKK